MAAAPLPVDLARLARAFPDDLGRFVHISGTSGKAYLDWSDGDAVRAVTAATLLDRYGVRWSIPAGMLCPAVPNRKNYVDWVHTLLQGSREGNGGHLSHRDAVAETRGLDVGTGASCIYPIIGACEHGWHVVGTDVSDAALASARRIVEENEAVLRGRIEVRDSRPRDGSGSSGGSGASGDWPALLGALREGERFDFTMCNPPFFGRGEEESRRPPAPGSAHYGGSDEERITDGGEERFVERMVRESFVIRGRVCWYSSMLGKKASLLRINGLLKRNAVAQGVTCIRTATLAQGRTFRWAIAWSFTHTSDVGCMIRDAKNARKARRRDREADAGRGRKRRREAVGAPER